MNAAALDRVLARVDAGFADTCARLADLVRIPSVSFPGFPAETVERSATATADWLRDSGWPTVRVARLDGVPPYVLAADRRAGPSAPTVLLYAHHDVQPPLREALWRSGPFTPTVRDGRMYGRGAADDKAGIALHAAAVRAWCDVAGAPPVNLVALIEGEEEVGSPHLEQVLDAHAAELRSDVLVIADLANVDTGIPSITTSLRGLVAVEVELRALTAPLHSGLWGGAVGDAAQALCRLIATLTDADGRIAIAGVLDGARAIPTARRAQLAGVPLDAARLAEQAGAVDAAAVPHDALERMWLHPSLAVNAIQAGERGRTGNVLIDAAWARIGIRIVPDQQPDDVLAKLTAHLHAHAPRGMQLSVTPRSCGAPWATDTTHPVFAHAKRALALGYDRDAIEIGCGASVPFVGMMSERLGTGGIPAPALLLGVEDPVCGAHSENESVHLDDLRKAIRAEAALFALLAGGVAAG